MHDTLLGDPLRDFRLIDIQENRIVHFPLKVHVDYCALSYMWDDNERYSTGNFHVLTKANLAQAQTPGGFSQFTLVPLLVDIISLCKVLGQRYIWVDRFCIVQDDVMNKASQVQSMDRVYSEAQFTICLAINTKIGSRVPGYKVARTFDSAKNYFTSPLFNPTRCNDCFIDGTLWSSRCWTFQERFVSKARLYISDGEFVVDSHGRFIAESECWMVLFRGIFVEINNHDADSGLSWDSVSVLKPEANGKWNLNGSSFTHYSKLCISTRLFSMRFLFISFIIIAPAVALVVNTTYYLSTCLLTRICTVQSVGC